MTVSPTSHGPHPPCTVSRATARLSRDHPAGVARVLMEDRR